MGAEGGVELVLNSNTRDSIWHRVNISLVNVTESSQPYEKGRVAEWLVRRF